MFIISHIIDAGRSSTVTSSVTSTIQNSPASHATQNAGYNSQGLQLLGLNSGTTHPESLEVNDGTTNSESLEFDDELTNLESSKLSDDTNDSDQQHDQVADSTGSETQNYGDSNVGASRW